MAGQSCAIQCCLNRIRSPLVQTVEMLIPPQIIHRRIAASCWLIKLVDVCGSAPLNAKICVAYDSINFLLDAHTHSQMVLDEIYKILGHS